MEKIDLIDHIRQLYPKLSKGQKAIAAYIMENYDQAAFMTAGALGRKVGVSESTVVRFACVLGYEGYPKLQKHLQESIKNQLTTVQRLNLMKGMDADKIIDTVLRMEISNLKATRQDLDTEMIKRVVKDIVNARRIYVVGFRSSAPLAQFLVYYLGYIFENPQLVTLGTSDIYAQLVHVSHEDVVIGLGFPRYSTQTVEGLRFAKRRGAKVVTITDNRMSPLYDLADNCILTKSDMNSFVDSLVAPLSIINALIIMIGLERKDYLLENFSLMEQVWREKNVYAKHDYDFMHKDEIKP
ncbi:MAG: MurR/RpiR family transcriptional regulator [Christensenellaceae bacterium]|nr:MurR/RpiR family transcriptional regulator [Christensenellaceae bacterium]